MTPISRLLLALACVAGAAAADNATDKAAGLALWKDKVQPILAQRCYECHGEKKAKHDLRLDSKEGILKGGKEDGPAIIAGNPAESPIIQLVELADGSENLMPAKGKRLTKDEVDAIRAWITAGAPFPEPAAK